MRRDRAAARSTARRTQTAEAEAAAAAAEAEAEEEAEEEAEAMAALESANRRLPESPRDGGRAVDLAMASRAAIARVASTAGQRAFGTGSVCPVPTASRIAKLLIQVQRQRR